MGAARRIAAVLGGGGAAAAGLSVWSGLVRVEIRKEAPAAAQPPTPPTAEPAAAQPPASPTAQPAAADRLQSWQGKWSAGSTRWHLTKPHPVLRKYEAELLGSLEEDGARCVLFPLCGSSVDLAYLARRGHDVVGVEGVGLAIDALLKEWGEELNVRGMSPAEGESLRLRVGMAAGFQKMAAKMTGEAERGAAFVCADLLRAVQGDFFSFTPAAAARYGLGQFEPVKRATNGTFDAAFDRAALVSVHPTERRAYADALSALIAPQGRVLLVAVERDPPFGPPHSLSQQQVGELFSGSFDVRLLHRESKLDEEPEWAERGVTRFDEVAYLLTKKARAAEARA